MGRNAIRLACAVVLLCASALAAAGDFSKRHASIQSFDGTALGALVLVPEGEGPFPLLVMPASWALPNLEYLGRARQLAAGGYVVVSYTSRGFWDSAGRIDIAGPATVEDVSAVIDWALANTPADPAAIGASGISYGAGTSLLAAGRDPRIKAVAALSGWSDLEASLYANRTVSQQGVGLLVAAGALTGRPGPELTAITARVLLGDYDGAVQGMLPVAPERGARSELARINLNGTAVLLGNAFNDGLFPPNPLVDFFNGLTGPRQLILSQGDHATAELPGALGLSNEVYDAATRWFDHHLRGLDNGVPGEPQVRMATLSGDWQAFGDWDAVQADATDYGLSRPGGFVPTGGLTGTANSGWTHRIGTGLPTLADSGVVLVSGLLQGLGLPATASIPLVSRVGAAVWVGPAMPATRTLVGSPALRITVTPSQSSVSLFAYLYRMDRWGTGHLLSHKPYSLRGVPPGVATPVDIALEATAAEIRAGERLVLVIDTTDPRYADATSLGGTVAFSSPASRPARLRLSLK